MRSHRFLAMLAATVLTLGVLSGCEQGPMQKAGEKVDKAVDSISGKGPVEKAGERVDKAVDQLKK
jgi:hypothetical protein